MRNRRIEVILGSASDGAQTLEGLKYLQQAPGITADDVRVHILSAHRNTAELLTYLMDLTDTAAENPDTDFFIIAGAGWAAILPGLIMAYLYYDCQPEHANVFVVPVAFAVDQPPIERDFNQPLIERSVDSSFNDKSYAPHVAELMTPELRKNVAAVLSISEVPGNMMLRADRPFFGPAGFLAACKFAATAEIADAFRAKIAAMKAKPSAEFNLEEAIAEFSAPAQ